MVDSMRKAKKEKTMLIQTRIPIKLIERLDKLVEEGWYRNRTEAIEDAIRLLILRYKPLGDVGKLVLYRLRGRLKDIDPLEIVFEPSIREDIVKAFGTDNIDDVIRVIRRRI